MNKEKYRLDIFLVQNGLIETRSKAQQLIKDGLIKVNDKICKKSGTLVSLKDKIEVLKNLSYVSRGGIKLEYALKNFKIDVRNKVCLDIGASTGGFTDCLLQHGAKLVYAVDVGHNQLHPRLKNNPQVLSFEGVDIRNFVLPQDVKVDLICVDVSFISLTLILEVIRKFVDNNGEIIILIKPQFEVGINKINKKGIVKNEKDIKDVLKKVLQEAQKLGLSPFGLITSPILGKNGNREYLAYLKLNSKINDNNKKSIEDLIIELDKNNS